MGIMHLKDGVVAGMLLGDAHYHIRDKHIELCHTLPQLSYLKFKVGLLQQLGFSCRQFDLTKKRTSVGVYDYCSATARDIHYLASMNLSLTGLLEILNPLGLMIWWLDDGCLSVHTKQNGSTSRFGYLNTQRYGLEENRLICQMLYQKFGIETSIHVDSKSGLARQDHYRIYLNATNIRRLIDLVREFIPWVPVNMRYKFNMQYVINRMSNSLEMATHYNF